jgi:hypothetical protein
LAVHFSVQLVDHIWMQINSLVHQPAAFDQHPPDNRRMRSYWIREEALQGNNKNRQGFEGRGSSAQ